MAKPVKKAGGKRRVLANELRSLIPKIDEEGLMFLLKQAQTIMHNLNVDRINKALDQSARTGKKTAGKSGARAAAVPSIVRIEDSSAGKHFVVVLGRERKMFTREELRKIVGISHAGKNDATSGQQIFSWLKKNRSDVLVDVGIGSGTHPLLKKLAGYLRTNYKVKK
ncbi:MAG TPA: hypothetical protein ENN69_02790 [Spirochaetia bacterium]|nr:hypothetical protein [Spirochaetia bacterium]